jgi:hypothetical protein
MVNPVKLSDGLSLSGAGKVNDDIDVLHRLPQRHGILKATDDILHLIASQGPAITRGAHETAHLPTAFHQLGNHVDADKTGSARH